jgi:hypothetical protein
MKIQIKICSFKNMHTQKSVIEMKVSLPTFFQADKSHTLLVMYFSEVIILVNISLQVSSHMQVIVEKSR